MVLDYETLRVIWWGLLGVLLIGFAIMDGFDLGALILLPFVAKTNEERRIVINTLGPVWEGNQVWFILGGGAIFAAFPMLYSLSFSGFYFAMLLVLLALILRPLAFKYRSKLNTASGQKICDAALFISGFVPSLIFGVALGNILQGVPFYFDETLRAFYTGSFIALLNPFAIVCGLTSVAMLTTHGSLFLCIKTEGEIQRRANQITYISTILFVVLFALAGYWISHHISGYTVTSTLSTNAPSNPLYKQVIVEQGAWMHNYATHKWWLLAPIAGFIGAFLIWFCLTMQKIKNRSRDAKNETYYKFAWIASALSISGTIATVGASMFPFILPSSSYPNMSLLVWDCSSSQTTLFIMLIATVIFMPIIIAYTSWVYYVLRGKVTGNDIQKNNHQAY